MHQTDTSDDQTSACAGKTPLRIIISRGANASSFTVRPLMAGLAAGTCMLVIGGYLAAAGYLMLREDITDTARLNHATQTRLYEERIANLRARVDEVTSRSLVAEHKYETQIKALKERQGEIDARHSRVADVLARAAESGLTIATSDPLPVAKPRPALTLDGTLPESTEAAGGTMIPIDAPVSMLGLRGSMGGAAKKADRRASATPSTPPANTEPTGASAALRADAIIMSRIDSALDVMNRQSETALDLIAVAAERRIARIERVTRSLGLDLDVDGEGIGGPFVPITSVSFDARLARAEKAVAKLSTLRDGAKALPFASPLAGTLSFSSTYGPRLDPFLRSPAMHTGLDFRAPTGTPVHATAAGTVVSAGRKGGYGLMVEIDHGDGVSTRFGHLSRILANAGDTVEIGDVIGKVGSTGRSTGSHLHYETRLPSGTVDPEMFLNAGEKLAGIL
ncbi:M23 family metallopeptidase [Breoghania sp.]|uniref:M23 family metallopeptidase n=1 Tax=Breoghania sp. TaxID=2065378 RepID=UPI002AA8783C|nr:M23 family metallopeptidase [Breoghania sp.]